MAPAYRWHRMFLQHLQSRHPGAAVGAEVARAHLVPRRAAGRVPERAARADAPRSVADHRVARRRSSRRCARWRATTTSIPDAAAEFADYILDGLDRSVDGARATAPCRPIRSSTCSSARSWPTRSRPSATIYERLGLELQRRGRAAHARLPRRQPAGQARQRTRYTFADDRPRRRRAGASGRAATRSTSTCRANRWADVQIQ